MRYVIPDFDRLFYFFFAQVYRVDSCCDRSYSIELIPRHLSLQVLSVIYVIILNLDWILITSTNFINETLYFFRISILTFIIFNIFFLSLMSFFFVAYSSWIFYFFYYFFF